jgi:hypothetical protein
MVPVSVQNAVLGEFATKLFMFGIHKFWKFSHCERSSEDLEANKNVKYYKYWLMAAFVMFSLEEAEHKTSCSGEDKTSFRSSRTWFNDISRFAGRRSDLLTTKITGIFGESEPWFAAAGQADLQSTILL